MEQCVFCNIVEKREDVFVVYEDASSIGILDKSPAAKGHVILIPKKHSVVLPMIDDVGKLFIAARKISLALIRAKLAEGTTIFVANGGAAGQQLPHTAIHIIPRKADDEINVFRLPQKQITPENQQMVMNFLGKKIKEVFNG